MSLPSKNSFANLGGQLVDYSPATDPTTDLPASCDDETRSDVSDMTRTVTKAWFGLSVSGSACSIAGNGYDATYGNAGIYKPVPVYSSSGVYTVTLPASIVDNLGVTRYISLQTGWASYSGSATFGYPTVTVTGPNTVTVRCYIIGSGPVLGDPPSGATITVFLL